ncbi:MAG: helix-hairpin-helix domain-containing protein [Bacilli bacterium]|nr:helix-hairpin-helix domain-containing protein [Bacilli bacterium]
MMKVIVIVLVATVICVVAFAVVDRVSSDIVDPSTNVNVSANYANSITVSIEGEVKHEGTYTVPLSSVLETLIEASGGITSNADESAFEVSYALKDGASYYIAPLYDNSNACAVTPIDKININSADKAGLMGLSSIGETVASSIVSYRSTNGTFHAIEELMNVSGIGLATFQKVKNYVKLRG